MEGSKDDKSVKIGISKLLEVALLRFDQAGENAIRNNRTNDYHQYDDHKRDLYRERPRLRTEGCEFRQPKTLTSSIFAAMVSKREGSSSEKPSRRRRRRTSLPSSSLFMPSKACFRA